MIDLGSTNFLLSVPSLPEPELARLSTSLFDSWETFVEGTLLIPDYSLFLQVEEGSIKGFAKMGSLLTAVYLGIGNYGGFISGLNTISEQLRATKSYLAAEAGRTFSCPESKNSARKRGGSLPALQRLFVRVQKREMTPEEAMVEAEILFGNDAAAVPGFLLELENAFRTCPRFHEQHRLPLGDEMEDEFEGLPGSDRPNRPPHLRPVLGPPLQFRVEVWRESKNKHKQTRVVRL